MSDKPSDSFGNWVEHLIEPKTGFQLCPVCNGTGIDHAPLSSAINPCTVCNGKKIISVVTGKPPE